MSERRLLRAAPPVLERLVGALGERAHLSVLDGPLVLTLLSHSPPHAVQAAGWAGRSVPAYCTAAGRALLADHEPQALRALLAGVELAARGPNTVASLASSRRACSETARRGYAVADEELEPGLAAVAAPVRALRWPHRRRAERVRALVPLRARLEAAAAEVARAAGELSSRLRRGAPLRLTQRGL